MGGVGIVRLCGGVGTEVVWWSGTVKLCGWSGDCEVVWVEWGL